MDAVATGLWAGLSLRLPLIVPEKAAGPWLQALRF